MTRGERHDDLRRCSLVALHLACPVRGGRERDLVSATVVVSSLRENEAVIERGLASFVEVGNALMRIRDGELYREDGFGGFVEYLNSKSWGLSRTRSYELIDSASVSAIAEIGNEAQARELAPLLKKATPEVVQAVFAELAARGNPLTASVAPAATPNTKALARSTYPGSASEGSQETS
jgi:hypothetical protein